MKRLLTLLVLTLTACSTLTPTQSALLTTSANLARIAVEGAATYYKGPAAGALASDGLDALAAVAQAYVGGTIPSSVVIASPGIKGVGSAIVAQLAPNHVVTQADVNDIAKAALIAKTLGVAVVTP